MCVLNYNKKQADRAKSIKTDAKVNHEATDKLIKELIAEKERLLRELENAKTSSAGAAGIGFSEQGQSELSCRIMICMTDNANLIITLS